MVRGERPDHRATILVVDDTPSVLSSICELLQDEHDLLVATCGEDALALAASERPDLILMDVVMPGMDGYTVCSRLKSRPATAGIPIIFLTVLRSDRAEAHGLQVGASDFVGKPINPAVLRARIANQLALKRTRDELLGLSFQDSLTGVANRRAFDAALVREWNRGARTGSPLSLVMVDVDHFKAYNDKLGHVAGDACLREVARALQGAVPRPVDLLARYGGEEFACLLPDTDLAGASQVAGRLLEAVRGLQIPHPASSAGPFVTASLGLATQVPLQEAPPEGLIAAADHILYEAKRQGRNQVGRTPSPESRPTIMLVEDDKHIRALMTERLAFLDATVRTYPQAQSAMAALEQDAPDLILSDAVMPGLDGFDFCRAVKADPAHASVPFALLTSLSRGLRERSLEAGADDYLSKLEDPIVFRLRVRALLELGLLRHAKAGASSATFSGAKFALVSPGGALQNQVRIQIESMGGHLRVFPHPEAAEGQLEDVELLILDGVEGAGGFLERLHGREKLHRVGVVMLCGREEEPHLAALESWIDDRLIKPLDPPELRQRLWQHLRLRSLRRSPQPV